MEQPKVRNSENVGNFENNILKLIRLKPNSFFNCCDLKGIRLITRLRLELSHLREHKFKYNFQNCLNPFCSCGSSIESTSHFLLHCPIFQDKRHTLLNILNNIDFKILESNDSYLTRTCLSGSTSFDSRTKRFFLTQPLTVLYPLKDSKSLFSYAIYLNLSDKLFLKILFPGTLDLRVPGDCDFLVYYIYIYILYIYYIYYILYILYILYLYYDIL